MTPTERISNTTVAVAILGALLWLAYMMGSITWFAYGEDQRYATSATRADGRISGYTYWDGGKGKSATNRAGYYATVTRPGFRDRSLVASEESNPVTAPSAVLDCGASPQ